MPSRCGGQFGVLVLGGVRVVAERVGGLPELGLQAVGSAGFGRTRAGRSRAGGAAGSGGAWAQSTTPKFGYLCGRATRTERGIPGLVQPTAWDRPDGRAFVRKHNVSLASRIGGRSTTGRVEPTASTSLTQACPAPPRARCDCRAGKIASRLPYATRRRRCSPARTRTGDALSRSRPLQSRIRPPGPCSRLRTIRRHPWAPRRT